MVAAGAAHTSNARELGQQTLNFELEMPQMAQTDPVRHRANPFAMFVRFAPGTNGDGQTEFCLTGYRVHAAQFMRSRCGFCNRKFPRPVK